MFSAALLLTAIASFTQLAFAAPVDAQAPSSRLIVMLKDGSEPQMITNKYARNAFAVEELQVMNAVIVDSNDISADELRALPEVASVVEDTVVSIDNLEARARVVQPDAPWGIRRLSPVGILDRQDDTLLDFEYKYDPTAGEGADVYVIDTGVRITHEDFEDRATWGATFGGYDDADGNGHGTHCAGTIAGARWGVAKKAHIIAVKVLSDGGFGSSADVISGMNYVYSTAPSTGRPSIVSMSLGGGANGGIDAAVEGLLAAGIHVVVAAGNNNGDASTRSPARVPGAITVGATDISDTKASFSNYGSIVDIFAPGVHITSAWATSDTATNSISGTSMATPHVAGVVAMITAKRGNTTPPLMADIVKSWGVDDLIFGLPAGTPNVLAHNRPSPSD